MVKSVRFVPQNSLAGKARRLPDTTVDELCERASRAVDAAKEPLFAKLEEEAGRLKSKFDALLQRRGGSAADIRSLNAIAFELKGLGGMFDYPLVSSISGLIFKMTKPDVRITKEVLNVIGLQVDAVTVAMRERRKGDGGDGGQALVASLTEAMEKVLANDSR